MTKPVGTQLNVSRIVATLVVVLAFAVTASAWWLPDPLTATVELQDAEILMIAAPDIRLQPSAAAERRVEVRPPWAAVEAADEGRTVVATVPWQWPVPPRGLEWVEHGREAGLSFGRWTNPDAADATTSQAALTDFDALQNLSSVRVMRDDELMRVCSRAFGRHRCGPDGWNWVGPTTQTIAGQMQSCTWLHPHADGALVLRFEIPEGYRRLNLQFAFTDHAAQTRTEPVEVAVNLDGEGVRSTRSDMSVLPRVDWQDHSVTLPDGHTGLAVNVAIRTDEPGLGHLCGRAMVSGTEDRATASRRTRPSTSRLEGLVRARLRMLGLSTPRWMRLIRPLFRQSAVGEDMP